MKELIEVSTNKGDTVLDPCMGSGSTGLAAIGLGRNYLGIELDKNYFLGAKERIEQEILVYNSLPADLL